MILAWNSCDSSVGLSADLKVLACGLQDSKVRGYILGDQTAPCLHRTFAEATLAPLGGASPRS